MDLTVVPDDAPGHVKRVYFYGTVDNLTGLNGCKGVTEQMVHLFVKATVMYVKLVQWYVLLWSALRRSSCGAGTGPS